MIHTALALSLPSMLVNKMFMLVQAIAMWCPPPGVCQ